MNSNFFDTHTLPIDTWSQIAAEWLIQLLRPFTQGVRWPVEAALNGLQQGLLALPFWVVLLGFLVIGWRAAGWRVGVFSAAAMFFIGLMGLWNDAIITLAVVLCAGGFTLVIGLVLGIVGAQSPRAWTIIRPILDIMQATPSLVYLVPVVMLFGIGTVPGVIASMTFSIPPMIRMTYLGLTQTPEELIDASNAYGSTSWQTLWHIRLPLALPSIAAGLNQVIMFSLVMSAIVSMIGADGLGAAVLRAVGRLDLGLALTAGLSIVLMAVSLDRMTQRLGQKPNRAVRQPKATLKLPFSLRFNRGALRLQD